MSSATWALPMSKTKLCNCLNKLDEVIRRDQRTVITRSQSPTKKDLDLRLNNIKVEFHHKVQRAPPFTKESVNDEKLPLCLDRLNDGIYKVQGQAPAHQISVNRNMSSTSDLGYVRRHG